MQRLFLRNWRKKILDNIYEYIANKRLSPENAKGQVDRIKKVVTIGMN